MIFFPLRFVSIFFVCFYIFFTNVEAQTRKPKYKLLWKISGNGITKPSYLFGTMHLKDKRVFDFSDSVLTKISECQTFALEIHPDTLFETIYQKNNFNKVKKIYSSTYYKNKLSKEEYKKLDDKIKFETGNSLDNIPNQSPSIINFLLKQSFKSKAEKHTFLDAYLYYLARIQGKQIVGIEKVNEQININDTSKTEKQISEIKYKLGKNDSEDEIQKLISIYQSGDIEQIYNFLFPNNDSYYLKDLTTRNITMAKRLDSIMKNQSIFFAVGAAHLAGEKGLIQLLKNKGYTLSAVESPFTGLAEKFIIDPTKDKWRKFIPPADLYSVDLPGKPYDMHLNMFIASGMFTYNDIGTGVNYFIVGVPNVVEYKNEVDREKALKTFLKNAVEKEKNKVLNQKKIIYEGKNGYEIEFFNPLNNVYFKIRLLFNENIEYLLMAGGEGKYFLNDKDIDRFFTSFKINNVLPDEWKYFSNSIGAFSAKLPGKIKTDSIINDEIKVYTYSAQSIKDGKAYAVLFGEFPSGKYLSNDSIYFNNIMQGSIDRINLQIKTKSYSEINSIPTLEYSGLNKSIIYFSKVLLRDNRPYILIMATSVNDSLSKEKKLFFDSFSFIPYLKTDRISYSPPDKSFTINFPANPIITKDSIENEGLLTTEYVINDPSTGIPYQLNVSKASPYLYFANSDSLFNKMKKNILEKGDSIVFEKKSGLGSEQEIEWVIDSKGDHISIRRKVYVKSNHLYEQISFNTKKDIFSNEINSYFNSLIIKKVINKEDLFTNKTKVLLSDLTSTDTTINKAANKALYSYPFVKSDTKILIETLDKKYADDTAQYGGLRQLLFNKLDFDNHEEVIPFVEKIYPTLSDNSTLQRSALRVLIRIASKKSLSSLVKLLLEKPLKDSKEAFYIFLDDSITNVKALYPKIYKLLDQKVLSYSVYQITLNALDSNVISKNELLPIKERLLSEANTYLSHNKNNKEDDDEGFGNLSTILSLLAYFPEDKNCERVIKSALDYKDNFIKWHATKILIKSGKTVESKYFNHIAADKSYLIEMYTWLKENKKLLLFPKSFINQQLFAESALYTSLNEDSDSKYNFQFKLIEKRTVNYQEKKGVVYLFKFEQANEDGKLEWYTGMSGLYSIDKSDMENDWNLTYSKFETLKSKTINEHFTTYLSDMETK